jgi:ubiquitin C-terminal hydrolase
MTCGIAHRCVHRFLFSLTCQCKKHQAATKKLEIYKAPDILVICIKRFGSSRRLSDKVSPDAEGLSLADVASLTTSSTSRSTGST